MAAMEQAGETVRSPFGLDGRTLDRLSRARVSGRRSLAGPFPGPRRSPQRGGSIEFADFRDYAPGDDLRRVDWNAYARLDRLFLRLYSAERMTTLTIVLDHSRSMAWGRPLKSLIAARIAAVLSYIALGRYDRVSLLGLGAELDRPLSAKSGTGAVRDVWQHIGSVMSAASGTTDFSALRRFPAFRRGPGITLVLSDFLSDTDWRGGLRALRGTGQDVAMLQILAPDELVPSLRGDWALADVETGARLETSITSRLVDRYAAELEAHTAALTAFARTMGMAYVQVCSDLSTESIVRDLYRSGLVQ